jgi:hypothetical protein
MLVNFYQATRCHIPEDSTLFNANSLQKKPRREAEIFQNFKLYLRTVACPGTSRVQDNRRDVGDIAFLQTGAGSGGNYAC